MQTPRRDIKMFSLSALDLLAMSTGVFVLLLLMMFPYYRKTLDEQEHLRQLAVSLASARNAAKSVEAAAAREHEIATAVMRDAQRALATARALEARAEEERYAAAPPSRRPPVLPRPVQSSGTSTVAELDLVFVVDTTASMTPAIRELAASMRGIVRVLEQLVPSLRVGIVSYTDRDTGRDPLAILPLTAANLSLTQVLHFLASMQASTIGSQTIQEDVLLGLQAAIGMPLRSTARQTFILIGDAAAHEQEQAAAVELVHRFVAASERRSVSALFVVTPSARANGMIDRQFFSEVARAGSGIMTSHTGSMFERVLLSVIGDASTK
jgi:hypothetical protein